MKKELRILFTGIMFLTRLPVPRSIDHSDDYLRQAPRYFPVVGWIVGGCCGVVFWLLERLVSVEIAVVASMVTGLLITGCFHEDGFADVCDGMGGGWTKEKILLIMKDSRIGAYGAIGLVMILLSKFALLQHLAPSFITILLAAHTISRLMPVLVMKTGVYAADPDQSKAKPLAGPGMSVSTLVTAVLLSLPPLFLPFFTLHPWIYAVVLAPPLLITFLMYRWFSKWIGGYTGDCLGSIQQVTEIVIYLGCNLVWIYL
jgi:adenosylcobinamide-GDP ribazoletransferase